MSKLKRALGLPSLMFYGVGVIIGAGIYSIIGAAAGEAGRLLWLSLLLAAVPAVLAALCYAELCTRFPRAGASYVYLREALPQWRWPAFMIGFTVAMTAAATAATVAIAFGGYLALFVALPAWLSALLLLIACTAVNIIGIRESAWVTAIFTLIEVLGLLVIIIAGVGADAFTSDLFTFSQSGASFAGVLSAAALSFFVFTGFEGLANLSEEARKPRRNLPWALMASLALTTVLYVLVAVAATALVSPRELASSDSPLATAAGAADAPLAAALGWIALFSTANTALITVIVGSRLLFGMAEEGDMPEALAKTLPARRTPWVAAIVILLASAALLPLGAVAVVGSVSSLLTLIVFLGVGAALVIIRLNDERDSPTDDDVFRVPLSIGRVPIVPLLLAASIVALASRFDLLVYLVAAGTMLAGGLLSLGRPLWSREEPSRIAPIALHQPLAAEETSQ